MSPGADLFIVCKHCGSEVSPYITECPYCGHRLRRRAPKLPSAIGPSRTRSGLLGRIPSRSPDGAPARERPSRSFSSLASAGASVGRPYATIAIVATACVIWILLRAGYVASGKLLLLGQLHGDWWKLFSGQFSYLNGWYAFFTLLVVAVFGWLLERRHGPLVVLALFLGAGAAGALVALAVYPVPIVAGGDAGALALLTAWAAPDLLAARRSDYYEGDLLGAGAVAVFMLALPFAVPKVAWFVSGPNLELLVRPGASWLAGVVGAALGLLFGLGLARIEQARA
jgi:membrane associated rhomboid family serine protease